MLFLPISICECEKAVHFIHCDHAHEEKKLKNPKKRISNFLYKYMNFFCSLRTLNVYFHRFSKYMHKMPGKDRILNWMNIVMNNKKKKELHSNKHTYTHTQSIKWQYCLNAPRKTKKKDSSSLPSWFRWTIFSAHKNLSEKTIQRTARMLQVSCYFRFYVFHFVVIFLALYLLLFFCVHFECFC